MTVDKRLLRERDKIKKSRPKFRRQESWRYKRIKTSWRRPSGIDNKMRHHRIGIPKIITAGYRGPKATRGLTKNGKLEVLVHNVKELEKIEKEAQIARIASTVGVKKKVAITNRADELEIKIINRPEEALTFATISEISDELLAEEESSKKKVDDKKERKKRTSSDLSESELEELEKIELELKKKSSPKKTSSKTAAKKPTTTKPKPTETKTSSTTTAKPKATTTTTKPKTTTTTAKPKTTTTTTKPKSTTTTTAKKSTSTTTASSKKTTTTTKKDTTKEKTS